MAAVMTKGICEFCGQTYSRRGIKRHLDSCPQRARGRISDTDIPYYTLLIEDAYDRDYWLYVEVSAKATLEDLDRFLRDIWLECCGHLSQFIIGGERFLCAGVELDWGDVSMDISFRDIARPGLVFEHEYDFGSTTTLKLACVSARLGGLATEERIKLLARNNAPNIHCDSCGKEAEWFVTEDFILLCDSCAEKYDLEEEWSLPVLNSPRTGVCGYGGDW